MLISTRGKYALMVMMDLAEFGQDRNVPMNEVAKREELPLKYLEQILPVLTKNKMIEGVHGKGGGYRLTRSPDKYTVCEILCLTEGTLAPVSCLEDRRGCANADNCRILPMWIELNDLIYNYLSGLTLADLLNGERFRKNEE